LTTKAQFLTEAKKHGLISAMESRGFEHLKGLDFFRKYGEDIYQLLSGGVSYGENLTFDITCIVPELNPKYMVNFPINVPLVCGGGFGDEYFTPELWEIGTMNDVENTVSSILKVFDGFPIQWFNSIKTRKDFTKALFPHIREKAIKDGVINSVLSGWKK